MDKSHDTSGKSLPVKTVIPQRRYEFHESDKPFYVGYREYRHRSLKFAKSHGGLEIGYQALGSGLLYLEGQFHSIKQGQIYILDPMLAHGHETVGDETCGVLVAHIPIEAVVHLSPFEGDLRPLRLFMLATPAAPTLVDSNEYLRDSLKRAHSLYNKGFETSKLLAWGEIVRVIVSLVATVLPAHEREQGGRNRMEPIAKALNNLTRNPEKRFSIAELAASTGLSPSRFSHVFAEIMHCSPLQFRNRLRVNRAVELLHTSNMSVEQIAGEVGFNEVSAFRKTLKEITGQPPSRFR